MTKLRDTLVFEQDGKLYDLYNLPDGFVIKGDLNLARKNLDKLPDLSKVKVEGSFYCDGNELTSLEGAPKEVGFDFDCSGNKLTSLEGAPKEVRLDFRCSYNKLTSLEGAPKKVGGFYCSTNSLTSLKGAPKKVRHNFICADNNLVSLEGAPEEVGGNFDCHSNSLISLEGAPKAVGCSFFCSENGLTSLAGIAETVEGRIYADVENLEKYGGYVMPASIDDDLPYIEACNLKNNPIYQKEKLISEKSKNLQRKILRTIAAENVSPQKGVVNPKRSDAEKKTIKAILDKVNKGITD